MTKLKLEHNPENGTLFLKKNSVLMTSRGQISRIQNELETTIGPAASRIMYEAGRKYAQKAISKFEKTLLQTVGSLSKEKAAEKVIQHMAIWGYGKGEFLELDLDNEYIKMKVENSFNSLKQEKSDNPKCHFLSGVISGAAIALLDTEMHCIETKCKAMGHEHCEFEIITPEEEEKRRLG